MSQKQALKIGAVGAIVGGVIGLIANILHPRESGTLDNTEAFLEEVSGSDIWVADHFALMIAVSLLLAAFYGLTHSITGESGTIWARFGWGAGIVGVALGLTLILSDALAISELADTWADSSGAAKDLALAAGDAVTQINFALFTGLMLFLFGAVPVLYGVAMLRSTDYAPWLGWVGVIFGLVNLAAGVIQSFAGPKDLTAFVMFPIGSIVITLWIIYLGVLMWRRSAEVTASTY